MAKLVHRANVACPSHEASTLASSRHRDCRWVALRSHARHRRLQPSPVHTLACAHRTLQDPCARHGSRTLSKAHSCSSTRLLTILRLRSDEPNYLTAHGTKVPMWVVRLGLRSQSSCGESVRRTVNAVRSPPNRACAAVAASTPAPSLRGLLRHHEEGLQHFRLNLRARAEQ